MSSLRRSACSSGLGSGFVGCFFLVCISCIVIPLVSRSDSTHCNLHGVLRRCREGFCRWPLMVLLRPLTPLLRPPLRVPPAPVSLPLSPHSGRLVPGHAPCPCHSLCQYPVTPLCAPSFPRCRLWMCLPRPLPRPSLAAAGFDVPASPTATLSLSTTVL